jgi:hypothetical protein
LEDLGRAESGCVETHVVDGIVVEVHTAVVKPPTTNPGVAVSRPGTDVKNSIRQRAIDVQRVRVAGVQEWQNESAVFRSVDGD